MKKLIAVGSILYALPLLALAQQRLDQGRGLDSAFDFVLYYADRVVVVLIAIAFVIFLYGVMTYVLKAGEERTKAITQIVGGLIALVVMISAWGLVKLFQNTLGITDTQLNTPLPKVPRQ